MRCTHALFAAALFVALAAGPAQAQTPAPAPEQKDNVELIMSPREGGAHSRVRNFFGAITQRIGAITGHVLPFTKCEKWSVPKANVEAVKKEAAKRGVVVTELGTDWNQVMQAAAADTPLTPAQKAIMERAKAGKATSGVKLMSAPPPAVLENALMKDAKDPSASNEPAKIVVALGDNTFKTITRTSVEMKPDMCVWRGVVKETGGQVTMMWWPNGKMAATVQEGGQLYSIRHMGGRLYAMVEMSQQRMPQEHAPMPERMRSDDPNARDDPLVNQGDASMLRPVTLGIRSPKARQLKEVTPATSPPAAGPSSKEAVIDVVVAYTKKTAANYSDVKRELVDLSIEAANESFRKSGIGNVKLRLVHAYETDYVEEGTHFDHVWRFADKGDGYMDEIQGLRDKYKADVAVLIVDDPAGCGLATRVYADADEAYVVVHHDCAALTYSVAHEIGHIIGARHEPNIDKMLTPFPYGHGYVSGTAWRDIMSYKDSCGGCPRLPIWSSPKVLVSGEPAGTATQDNARVIAEQAARVAAFR